MIQGRWFLFVSLLALIGCASGGVLRSDLIFDSEDFGEAEEQIDRALEKEPENSVWRLRRAGLLYAMNRLPEAERLLGDLREGDEHNDNGQVLILHGLVLREMGRYEGAAAAIRLASEQRGDQSLASLQRSIVASGLEFYAQKENWKSADRIARIGEAHIDRVGAPGLARLAGESHKAWGKIEIAGGYYRDAIATFERCKTFVDDPECDFESGAAWASLGQAERAMSAMDRYLEAVQTIDAIKRVGRHLEENYFFDEALSLYLERGEKQGMGPALRTTVTELYLKRQEPAKGDVYALTALENMAGISEADWIDEAMRFQRYRHGDIAEKILDKAMENYPGSLDVLDAKARSLLFKGLSGDVERLFDDYAERFPDRRKAVGRRIETLGLVAEARTFYEQSARGGLPALFLDAARMASEEGDWRASNQLIDEFISAAPDKTRAREAAGRFFAERENWRAAERYFKDASRDAPQDLEVALALARVYREQGNLKKEQTVLERLRKRAGYSAPLYQRVGDYWAEQSNRGRAEFIFNDIVLREDPDSEATFEARKGLAKLYVKENEVGLLEALAEGAVGRGGDASRLVEFIWEQLKANTYEPMADLQALSRMRLKASPNDSAVHFEHGGLMSRIGYSEESVEALNRAIALSPAPEELFKVVVEFLSSEGKTDELLSVVSTYRDFTPPAKVSEVVGMALLTEGKNYDREAGQRYIRLFLEDQSLDTVSCLASAQHLRKQGFLELAEVALEKEACDESEKEVLAEWGLLRLEQGRLGDAKKRFDLQLRVAADPAREAEAVAGVLLSTNYPKTAQHYFEKALKTQDIAGWQRLLEPYSTALGMTGSLQRLREHVQTFLAKAKGTASAREAVIRVLGKQGLISEAVEELKRLTDQRRGSAKTEEALGIHAFAAGRKDIGLEAFQRAARLWGGAPQHVARLGEALEEQGLYEAALELYDEAEKVHPEHPILNFRRAVVHLGRGDADAAREALVLTIREARSAEGVIGFISPYIRASARIDVKRDILDYALERFPDQRDLLVESVDTQLLMGDVPGAVERASKALEVHPGALVEIGRVFDSHQLDRLAFGYFEKAIRADGKGSGSVDKDAKLLRGLLRTAQWTSVADMRNTLENYEKRFEHTPVTLELFIQTAASFGDFEWAMECGLKKVALDGKVTSHLQTSLLASHLGKKEAAQDLRNGAIQKAQTAEDAGFIAEAADNLRLSGHGLEARQLMGQALEVNEALTPWLGSEWIASELWSAGRNGPNEALEAILSGGSFLPMFELTRVESWYIHAGREEEFYKVLEQSLEKGFRTRVALLLMRAGKGGPELISKVEEHLGAGDAEGQLLLAGTMIDGGDFGAANRILDQVLARPASDSWKKALRLRVRSEVLAEGDLSWKAIEKWATIHNENKRMVFTSLRSIARDYQLWDVEEKALEFLSDLSPGSAVLWLHRMEVALFRGDIAGYRDSLEKLLRHSPNRVEVMKELVDALEGQFEYGLALELLDRILEKIPGDQSLVWRAGRLSLELGRFDRAERYFSRYERAHWMPNFARFDVDKAYLDTRFVRPSGAAVESKPAGAKLSMDWLGKSGALLQVRRDLLEGKERDGLALFKEQSVELRDMTSFLETGIFIREEHPMVNAEWMAEAVEKAVSEGASSSLRVRAFHASELLRGTRSDLGATRVKGLLKSGSRSWPVLSLMLKGAMDGERWDVVREVLQQQLDSPLQRKLVLVQIVELFSEQIQLLTAKRETVPAELGELAEESISALASLDPAHIWYATLGSDVAEAIGNEKKAEAIFEKAMRVFPRDSSGFNNLAYLYARRGTQLSKARNLVEQAMRLEPRHNVFYLDTAGWIAFKRGDLETARDLLLASLRQMNRSQGSSVAESLWHLGRVYEELGSLDDAIWCYRKAHRMAPSGAYGTRAEQELKRLEAAGSNSTLEQK